MSKKIVNLEVLELEQKVAPGVIGALNAVIGGGSEVSIVNNGHVDSLSVNSSDGSGSVSISGSGTINYVAGSNIKIVIDPLTHQPQVYYNNAPVQFAFLKPFAYQPPAIPFIPAPVIPSPVVPPPVLPDVEAGFATFA